jgi:hypothetical protein
VVTVAARIHPSANVKHLFAINPAFTRMSQKEQIAPICFHRKQTHIAAIAERLSVSSGTLHARRRDDTAFAFDLLYIADF